MTMRLSHLRATNYRSLHDVEVDVGAVNLLIGANASGKSNVLDALTFLSAGIRQGHFDRALYERGGIVHLAWKGEAAKDVALETQFEDGDTSYCWTVRLRRRGSGAEVVERMTEVRNNKTNVLLEGDSGKIWWKTPQAKDGKLLVTRPPTACALGEACADESFPGRAVGRFLAGWGFFDPNPGGLRHAAFAAENEELWMSGSNLAARLNALSKDGSSRFERILKATQRVLGVPESIDFRESEDGRVYFVQREPGLNYAVHQVGASSGTLRMLALMTALYGEEGVTLVGIEEPENYVHPKALKAFSEYLRDASTSVQLVITTHSPLLLDCFADASEVLVVRRTATGSRVERVPNPEAVDEALEQSGFGLGEFFETEGFGA